jgi:hypothetical protein
MEHANLWRPLAIGGPHRPETRAGSGCEESRRLLVHSDQGFLTFFDKLWQTINLRNDKQHYLEGFVMHAIDTFREISVREAILNAVSHRDYRHPGSVFVRQYLKTEGKAQNKGRTKGGRWYPGDASR